MDPHKFWKTVSIFLARFSETLFAITPPAIPYITNERRVCRLHISSTNTFYTDDTHTRQFRRSDPDKFLQNVKAAFNRLIKLPHVNATTFVQSLPSDVISSNDLRQIEEEGKKKRKRKTGRGERSRESISRARFARSNEAGVHARRCS